MSNDAPPVPTKKYHLMFLQSGSATIHRRLVYNIKDELNSVIKTQEDHNEIDMWIESPGGDAHATYKLFLELRNRCRTLRAIVPDYAKSAATLLMLGVDEIYMAASAELGPLDAQIEHPEKERTILSALDVADSLESLGRTSLFLAYDYANFYMDLMDLPRAEALKYVLEYMAQFMQPIVGKLDPHRIHQATNLLDVATDYGMRMLSSRKLGETKKLSNQEAKQLVQKLVRDYSSEIRSGCLFWMQSRILGGRTFGWFTKYSRRAADL
jgi:hypothetical protein